MSFGAEFLIPAEGEDELGQAAEASMTFLDYELELRYRPHSHLRATGPLEVVREQLVHINRSETKRRLGFPHRKAWRDSVAKGRRTTPYLSTDPNGGKTLISLHSDNAGGRSGRPRRVLAETLPRTMLSSVQGATKHRTLALARQEMAGWTRLQLEPSALREPDRITAPCRIAPNGASPPGCTRWRRPRSATIPAESRISMRRSRTDSPNSSGMSVRWRWIRTTNDSSSAS